MNYTTRLYHARDKKEPDSAALRELLAIKARTQDCGCISAPSKAEVPKQECSVLSTNFTLIPFLVESLLYGKWENLQRSAKRLVRGCEKFFPALA